MSGPLLLASLVLLATLAWALYDEFWGLRPWKGYQEQFVRLYASHLEGRIQEQAEAERQVRQSAAFERIEQRLAEAEEAVAPQIQRIDREVRDLNRRISVIRDLFAEARGKITAMIYEAETTTDEEERLRILEEVDAIRAGPFEARLPIPDGTMETMRYNYDELEDEYTRLQDRKAFLMTQRVELLEEADALRKERQQYLEENIIGLNEQQLRGLLQQTRNYDIGIKQIHVVERGSGAEEPRVLLVDRCESCHLGVLEGRKNGIELAAADLGDEKLFASHPTPELLAIHDPDRFGCSTCHGGNGRAISSRQKAHGRYKHWLWPLYYSENNEAGCQQCHRRDMLLDHADVLNRGKELYRLRGCIGCHRYEGFDNEDEQLQSVQQDIRQLTLEKGNYQLAIKRNIQRGDRAPTNEAAQRYYQRAENLRIEISNLDARVAELRQEASSLLREVKHVAPNLKEVRVKLRPEWIPVWLRNPHAWRPMTKMPRFRLNEEQVKAISAFIWQSGIEAELPGQPQGNPERGRELFMNRGCLACHSIGTGEDRLGGDFAANLSRVGEKVNYDFLVRWVHNPRVRTRPYCPLEKRDLTPEDYAKHGLPFEWSLSGARCPNDGEQLVVMSGTVMPNLRLTWEEARDIAAFLMTQRQQEPADYPEAAFIEDPELKERGEFWVKHFGCAGCHEIAGLENEGRIGTDLTTEGSKPIERLDFALLTEKAKRGILPDGSPSPRGKWYDHKGFFEHKLRDPAIFDQGKIKEPLDKLRMPKPNLTEKQVTALTTFLLGSTDPGYGFPDDYYYRPNGPAKDIQQGWWLITRYNCQGCHQVRIGEESVLMQLPQYQGENKENLPPMLIGAGARLNPEWIARFLENPALSKTDIHRNGIRSYLDVRMPTFYFSEREIQILVRFFQALAAQRQPYIPPEVEPLDPRERRIARELFTHQAAPCLRCHATGDATHDRTATAPNFLYVKERLKPTWTRRWIVDPGSIIPGTAMPTGLFRRQGDRWIFAGPLPPAARDYDRDHAELLVRYMFHLTPQEQRRLTRRLAAGSDTTGGEVSWNLVESH